MGDVRLDFYDLDADALPDVCMKCGAAAAARPVKQFAWIPYWARFTPWFIRIAFTKRRRVPIPLCEQHKNHWTIRYGDGLAYEGGLEGYHDRPSDFPFKYAKKTNGRFAENPEEVSAYRQRFCGRDGICRSRVPLRIPSRGRRHGNAANALRGNRHRQLLGDSSTARDRQADARR